MDYGFIGTLLLYTAIVVLIPKITEKAILSKIRFNRQVYTILSIGTCCCLACFRGVTGTDTNMYKSAYEYMSQGLGYDNRAVDFEIGYIFLNKLCGMCGFSFEVFLFVVQLLNIGFVFLAIRRMKKELDVELAMYIYMVCCYFTSFNMMRQSIAISICLYAFSLLNEEKTINYCILVAVAAHFHRSAFICLGVILVKYILQNKSMFFLQVMGVVAVLYLVFNRDTLADIVYLILQNSYYSSYFSRDTEVTGGMMNFWIENIPYFIIMLIGYNGVKDNKKISVHYWLLLVGYCLLILGKLTETQVHRIAYYFTYLNVFVFSYIVKNGMYLGNKRLPTRMVKVILQVYLYIFFYYDIFYRNYGNMVPYLGIWDK